MKIIINNKPSDTNAHNVAELIKELSMPERGVAVAIDMQMVQRTDWEETTLKENDNVTIIVAACGG